MAYNQFTVNTAAHCSVASQIQDNVLRLEKVFTPLGSLSILFLLR